MYNKSSTNTSNLREYVILLEPIEDNANNVGNYDSVVDLTNKNGTVTLASNQQVIVTGSGKIGRIVWELTPRYYNLNINQTENANKLFGGRVEIANLSCVSEQPLPRLLNEAILADNGGVNYISLKEDPNFTTIAYTNEGVFSTEDDYGTSYYFRGAVDNNWVYFANFYWRIIRINGNGSVRLIFGRKVPPTSDTSLTTNCSNIISSELEIMGICANQCDVDPLFAMEYFDGEDSVSLEERECLLSCGSEMLSDLCPIITGVGDYNRPSNRIETTGYMYEYDSYRGNEKSSLIKQDVDNWYKNNMLSFESYLSDSIFCNDRSLYYNNNLVSDPLMPINSSILYFGYMQRMINGFLPSNTCPDSTDAFTVNDISKGNGKLKYPVGLITGDELIFAGLSTYYSNYSSFLSNGRGEWTMSPATLYTNSSGLQESSNILVYNNASNGDYLISLLSYWRAVISLKDTVKVIGSGEWNDPYVVITD